MQILSPEPIRESAILKCRLLADVNEGPMNPFRATAIYCIPLKDHYLCGARIVEMHNSGVFNFFSVVHQLILDYESSGITANA
jgi:hypothetical protein